MRLLRLSLLSLVPVWSGVACSRGTDKAASPDTVDPGTTGTDTDDDPPSGDSPSGYDPDLPDASSATFDQSRTEAALTLAIAGLSGLSTDPVFDAYDVAMAGGEGYCPAYYEQDGNTFWYASCTTSTGTWYDGYGFYNYYEDYTVDDDGNVWDTEYISGAATVREATGETFHVGGYVQRSWTTDENNWTSIQEGLFGSFQADDAPADSWLGRGEQPSLYAYRAFNEDYGLAAGGYVGFQGSLGGLGDTGQVALNTELMILGTTSLGLPCQDEPGGSITVRTEDGGWWDITFDMDAERFVLTGDCDGCGTVTDAAGGVVGEACADFSPLLED